MRTTQKWQYQVLPYVGRLEPVPASPNPRTLAKFSQDLCRMDPDQCAFYSSPHWIPASEGCFNGKTPRKDNCVFEKEILSFGARIQPTYRPVTTISSSALSTRAGERVIICSHCSTCFQDRKDHQMANLPWTVQEQDEIEKIQLLRHLLASRQIFRGFSPFAKYESYDDTGKLATIVLVCHPYILREWTATSLASSWSVGVVYDVVQDRLVGFFDGLLPYPDRDCLMKSLDDNAHMLAHPFSIFCAILDVHVMYAMETAVRIYNGLNELELEFGLATRDGSGQNRDPWSMNQEGFRTCVGMSAKLGNHAIYLRKQVNLLLRFKEFLLDVNKCLSQMVEGTEPPRNTSEVNENSRSYRIMTTKMNNLGNILCSLQDYMEFLLKRIEVCSFFLTALMNYKEAKASSYNSSIASSVALTTMTFLPATAVATVFSMGVMNADNNGTLALSPSFWVYWAVTLPLTATTMLGWYAWVKLRPNLRNAENCRSATALGPHILPLTPLYGSDSGAWLRNPKFRHRSLDDESHISDIPPIG